MQADRARGIRVFGDQQLRANIRAHGQFFAKLPREARLV